MERLGTVVPVLSRSVRVVDEEEGREVRRPAMLVLGVVDGPKDGGSLDGLDIIFLGLLRRL